MTTELEQIISPNSVLTEEYSLTQLLNSDMVIPFEVALHASGGEPSSEFRERYCQYLNRCQQILDARSEYAVNDETLKIGGLFGSFGGMGVGMLLGGMGALSATMEMSVAAYAFSVVAIGAAVGTVTGIITGTVMGAGAGLCIEFVRKWDYDMQRHHALQRLNRKYLYSDSPYAELICKKKS